MSIEIEGRSSVADQHPPTWQGTNRNTPNTTQEKAPILAGTMLVGMPSFICLLLLLQVRCICPVDDKSRRGHPATGTDFYDCRSML